MTTIIGSKEITYSTHKTRQLVTYISQLTGPLCYERPLHASTLDFSGTTDLMEGSLLTWHARTAVQISFFSRNFSPFNKIRGVYCKTSLLHCQIIKKYSHLSSSTYKTKGPDSIETLKL